ncbi:MAG: hypothetical protein R6U04_04400 [Bacteroidales bacterium]
MGKNFVLIYTYYWPPSSAGAVWRFLKVSKYLPDYNWIPIIVTVDKGAYSAIDNSLTAEIPERLKVYKTKSVDPYLIYNFLQGKKNKQLPEALSKTSEKETLFQKLSLFIRANFFIPDPKIGWIPFAVKKGKEIIKKYPIKAVITTGPPNSIHLIGQKIRNKYNIPWIMDFRDPWTSNYIVKELMHRSIIAEKIDKKLENKALKFADCITGISPGLLEEFRDRAKRIETIYNGFDEEDFSYYEKESQHIFTLSYIGSLKPNQNILALWKAIAELKEEIVDFRQYFKLQFIGNLNFQIINTIKAYGLEEQLMLSEFIPHEEAIIKMQNTSLLLFIVPRAIYAKSITSGKIFEYMASRTPMLSLGPVDGEAAWILNKGKRDPIIDYDDKDRIKQNIKEKYMFWKKNNGLLPKHETNEHLYFSRKKQTGQFAEILNELCYANQKK